VTNALLIAKTAEDFVRKYGTRNPYKIAQEKGIHIKYRDDYVRLKGMYLVVLNNRFIYINSKLDENKQNIVCAHELGHDTFHKSEAEKAFIQEFELYDMNTRREYEANVFAASLLISDARMLEYVYKGYDTERIAKITNTDINLVALKADILIHKGYKLNEQEYDSKFLQ
jgi:Zn-dependent peptidase ImmA (M78 family)